MKYILILLISFAFGQITDESYEDMITRMDMEEHGFVYFNENSLLEWQLQQEPITFGNIFDYAEECYNDSVHIFDVPPFSVWYVEEVGEYIVGRDTLYYQTKPTFEGFIEWLKQ